MILRALEMPVSGLHECAKHKYQSKEITRLSFPTICSERAQLCARAVLGMETQRGANQYQWLHYGAFSLVRDYK